MLFSVVFFFIGSNAGAIKVQNTNDQSWIFLNPLEDLRRTVCSKISRRIYQRIIRAYYLHILWLHITLTYNYFICLRPQKRLFTFSVLFVAAERDSLYTLYINITNHTLCDIGIYVRNAGMCTRTHRRLLRHIPTVGLYERDRWRWGRVRTSAGDVPLDIDQLHRRAYRSVER